MASRGVNKVILIGRLGQKPDLRYFPDGTPSANFSLATSESWTDKQTGEPKERTEWHRVAMTGSVAEVAARYLDKGHQVYIEGQLRTRKWVDSATGQERYATEVFVGGLAGRMQMLGSGEPAQPEWGSNKQNAQAVKHAPAPIEDFDDDLPF